MSRGHNCQGAAVLIGRASVDKGFSHICNFDTFARIIPGKLQTEKCSLPFPPHPLGTFVRDLFTLSALNAGPRSRIFIIMRIPHVGSEMRRACDVK